MFANKAGAYSSMYLSDTPHKDRLLALPINIRLGWKGMPGINTLAYNGSKVRCSTNLAINVIPF
jgi:hypothetical protein